MDQEIAEILRSHVGHNVVIVHYPYPDEISLECEDCCEVLITYVEGVE